MSPLSIFQQKSLVFRPNTYKSQININYDISHKEFWEIASTPPSLAVLILKLSTQATVGQHKICDVTECGFLHNKSLSSIINKTFFTLLAGLYRTFNLKWISENLEDHNKIPWCHHDGNIFMLDNRTCQYFKMWSSFWKG